MTGGLEAKINEGFVLLFVFVLPLYLTEEIPTSPSPQPFAGRPLSPVLDQRNFTVSSTWALCFI